jgi:hypothetical protein
VADRVDPVVDAVQPARVDAVRDRAVAQPEPAELAASDHPVLHRRDGRNGLVDEG